MLLINFLIFSILPTNSAMSARKDVGSSGSQDEKPIKSVLTKSKFDSKSPNKAKKLFCKSPKKISPSCSPGTHRKLYSSLTALKRGASALGSSVTDFTKAANASVRTRLLHHQSVLETGHKRDPDQQSSVEYLDIPPPRLTSSYTEPAHFEKVLPKRCSLVYTEHILQSITPNLEVKITVAPKSVTLRERKTSDIVRKGVVSLPTDFQENVLDRFRPNPGRKCDCNIKSDSELYGSSHLKAVLNVLRSDASPEEKLRQIQKSHAYWERVGRDDSQVFQEELEENPNTAMIEGNPEKISQMSQLEVASPDTPKDELATAKKTELPKKGPATKASKNTLALHINTDIGQCPQAPKSPVTVQEWVNSIDLDGDEARSSHPDPVAAVGNETVYQIQSGVVQGETSQDSVMEDNLNLGAEARNLEGVIQQAVSLPASPKRKDSLSVSPSHRISLADFRTKQSSFNSETSTFSTVSSLSSVESLLESRKEDPEEILLALGFGGSSSQDPLARIPQRFLCQPSIARGVDLETFLKQQEEEFQKQECSCLGYRGLADYSKKIEFSDTKSGILKKKRSTSVKFWDEKQLEAIKLQHEEDNSSKQQCKAEENNKVPEIAITTVEQKSDSPRNPPVTPDWLKKLVEEDDILFATSSSCSFSSTETAVTPGYRKITPSSLV